MKLWRGLGNSVSPKPYTIEDHLVEQLIAFLELEIFVKFSHHDGFIDHARTKNSMSQEAKATQHSLRKHKWLLPSVCYIVKINHKAKRLE